MNSIEVYNLTKKFGSFISVDDISFTVNEGEVFGFLGSNGAGKSTTIKMLCGIISSTSGDALVGGYSINKDSDKVKLNIGYMSQRFSLYNDLTIEENINFFGGVYGLTGAKLNERKKWVLDIADLNGKEKILTGSLPGGIKQRLALGTAVIHSPKIVFLDEPTSGVDPLSRRNFWDLINLLSAQGTTVFVTTHYLEEAEYCNNIILIDAGKLIAEGNPKQLKTKYITDPIFEISCTNPIESMDLLSKNKNVLEVSLFGNSLHVLVKDSSDIKENLIEYIKPVSEIKSIDKIVPTLEDVFIHLVDKREAND
ncbi:MAG: ABC transporter ATP-binding protein [Ignavibacteriaceae bacterium]|jgi:ABC-2 type transport system ATP-binding protein|nr:ABC transporter ATP-binding protein [Ignavibacteriaceae bacterium]